MTIAFERPERLDLNDMSTKTLAERHKRAIESYWFDRGYAVKVEVTEMLFHPALRERRWEVRSDLKDGLPTQKNETPACVVQSDGVNRVA